MRQKSAASRSPIIRHGPTARRWRFFRSSEIVSSFGVGYDHVDVNYAREHNIVVANTPDVLTEEVADIAMGLLIATLARIHQGRPLSAVRPLDDTEFSVECRARCGIARSGWSAWAGSARRSAAGLRRRSFRWSTIRASRQPVVSYKHYPDLIEMAKAVDTLVVIVPGGAATAKMINADVMKALGPRGVNHQCGARLGGR